MSKLIYYGDAKRFEKKFINQNTYRLGSDKNSNVLRKILKFQIKEHDSNFDIRDFRDHLYYDDEFNDKLKEVKTKLEESNYVFLHSYGKNGKSTLVYILENDLELTKRSVFKFDFSASKSKNQFEILQEKIDIFYDDFLWDYEQVPFSEHPFYLFFKYINDHYDNEKVKKIIDPVIRQSLRKTYKLSTKIVYEFKSYCDKVNGNYLIAIEKLKSLLYICLNENNNEFFTILLAVKIFYDIKYKDKEDIIILFDNLDDVYTYMPEEITTSYSANVIIFFENLRNGFTEIFNSTTNDKYVEPKFLFIYRTSNYLSTVSSKYAVSDSINSRVDLFNEEVVRRVRITSVKDSFKIIDKRLKFYEKLCNSCEIEKSPRYDLINNIIKAFRKVDTVTSKKTKFKPSNVLRLWNGNKLSFIDFALNVSISKNDLNIILNPKVESLIKTEIFFYLFINFFRRKADASSPISKFIKYTFNTFNNKIDEKKCGISRMFVAYVFNKRQEDLEINSVEDAFNKGISLKSFVDEIRSIKINQESCYSYDEIKEMLESLFSFEIDNWGNFFSCCAPPNLDQEKSPLDHYKWMTEVMESIQDPVKSEKIKFFNNDSSGYFMFQLRRSFEYFSISSKKGTQSLPSSISYTELENGKVSQMIFEEILTRVYERVKEVCDITYNFFEKAFPSHSVQEYCDSYWSIRNKIYFDDIIPRVIGYIEDVRFDALNGYIEIGGDYKKYSDEKKLEIKQKINEIFVKNIMSYFQLFDNLYNRSKVKDASLEAEIHSDELEKTKKAFDYMERRALRIYENLTDFETKIRSRKNENN